MAGKVFCDEEEERSWPTPPPPPQNCMTDARAMDEGRSMVWSGRSADVGREARAKGGGGYHPRLSVKSNGHGLSFI